MNTSTSRSETEKPPFSGKYFEIEKDDFPYEIKERIMNGDIRSLKFNFNKKLSNLFFKEAVKEQQLYFGILVTNEGWSFYFLLSALSGGISTTDTISAASMGGTRPHPPKFIFRILHFLFNLFTYFI